MSAVEVVKTALDGFRTGQILVTNQPTKVVSTDTANRGVILTRDPDQKDRVFVGDKNVTALTGLFIPVVGLEIPISQPSNLYAIAPDKTVRLTWMVL